LTLTVSCNDYNISTVTYTTLADFMDKYVVNTSYRLRRPWRCISICVPWYSQQLCWVWC